MNNNTVAQAYKRDLGSTYSSHIACTLVLTHINAHSHIPLYELRALLSQGFAHISYKLANIIIKEETATHTCSDMPSEDALL